MGGVKEKYSCLLGCCLLINRTLTPWNWNFIYYIELSELAENEMLSKTSGIFLNLECAPISFHIRQDMTTVIFYACTQHAENVSSIFKIHILRTLKSMKIEYKVLLVIWYDYNEPWARSLCISAVCKEDFFKLSKELKSLNQKELFVSSF